MRVTIETSSKKEELINTIVKNVTSRDYILVSSNRHVFREALTRALCYELTVVIDLV